MTYETFKKNTIRTFEMFMPKGAKFEVYMDHSVNVSKEALRPVDPKNPDLVFPCLYLKDIYDLYLQCKSMPEVMMKMALDLSKSYEMASAMSLGMELEELKDNIVFQMINKEQNKEFLETVPHRDFLDGALIYRLVLQVDKEGSMTEIVKNHVLDKWKISEDELFALAKENTRRLYPPEFGMMDNILKAGLGKELKGEPMPVMVLTNIYKENGAACIVYEDLLKEIAETVNSNLLIMPSSLHETLILGDPGEDVSFLSEIIHEINMSEVDLKDRLSNNVYRYDKDERKLTVATNSPYKRLDGKDMEVEKERKPPGKSFSR